jgi:lipoate-protein ligase A
MKQNWNFINTGPNSGFINMQTDLYLLDKAIKDKIDAILRVYSWDPPALSTGRNQPHEGFNLALCEELGIDIVKRPTGGRALFHQGEITYSLVVRADILPGGNSVRESYKDISGALIKACEYIGVKNISISSSREPYTASRACMAISTGADLEIEGRKIAGSAQLRKKGYIMQHGSILLNQDFALAARLFNVPPDSLKCINLSSIINPLPVYDELADIIKEAFKKQFNIGFTSTKNQYLCITF